MGGGGGGGVYYGNLDRLYGAQADNAAQLSAESRKTFSDLQSMRDQAQGYGSLANKGKAIADSAANSMAAWGNQSKALTENMESLGINPNDERFMRQMRTGSGDAYAQGAAGMTAAGNRADDKSYAMLSDITNMGLGLPGQATSAYNSAGNMASSAGQMRMNEANMDNQATAGMVRGGMDTAMMGKYMNWWADGGYVTKYAKGGVVGAMQDIQAPPAPASAPAPNPMADMMGTGLHGAMTYKMLTKPTPKDLATKQVDSVLPSAGIESSNAVNGYAGADYGAGAGAGAGADAAMAGEGAAAATTAGEGATAVASAEELLPLLLAADGGHITPFSRGLKGGKVSGPGGPKDDRIPAMLSDGEFVLPVGTVKKYGLAKLEKMRQEGLQFEKHLGIGRAH